MANKRKRTIDSFQDSHIHYNGKNYVYSDIITGKTGYVLVNADAEKYALYSSRLMLSLSVGILIFFVLKLPIVGIIAAVGIFTVLEVLFRVKFLNTCPKIDNYEKPKRMTLMTKLTTFYPVGKLVAMLLFGLGIIIMIPINVKINNYQGTLMYINYIICGCMAIYLVFVIIALIKKKTDK